MTPSQRRYAKVKADPELYAAMLAANREWHRLNKERSSLRKSLSYPEHRDRQIEQATNWRKNNQDLSNQHRRERRERNPGKYRTQEAERRANDPQFRLSKNLSRRIRETLAQAGAEKNQRTFTLVGCTIERLVRHLEQTAPPGLTIHDIGPYGLHIDHIRPLSSFNLTDPKEQTKAFHYTNLQLLSATDNLKKHARLDWLKAA